MNSHGKPEGARLGWQVLETTYPFATPWLKLRQDRVRIAGKDDIIYTYIQGNAAVFVVPVTADGQVILIRQYRYTVDAWCLEVPAGGTHDREGVSLEDVAREELAEEIGGTCAAIDRVADFAPATAGRIAIRPYTPIHAPYFNRTGLYRHTPDLAPRLEQGQVIHL